jgi:hypothetical protein
MDIFQMYFEDQAYTTHNTRYNRLHVSAELSHNQAF